MGILSDQTRAGILEAIREKGSMSYVEIQRLLGIKSTGKLNYHLKVIGDLLEKEAESGKYRLTKRGLQALGASETLGHLERHREKVRIERMYGMYIASGILIPGIDYLSYLALHINLLFMLIISINSYLLLVASYFVWKRAFTNHRMPLSERGRKYGMMYLFAVIFLFANIFILGEFEHLFPVINSFPPYELALAGIVPGALSGAWTGRYLSRYLTYHAILWLPF